MRVKREKLYEEVWTTPLTVLGEQHGVSSSLLTRVCKNLGIPLPGRGYWRKVEAGEKPARPPLPEAQPGDALEWSRDGSPARQPLPAPKAPDRPSATSTSRSRGPHLLTIGAEETLTTGRTSEHGYLKPQQRRAVVDVFVTSESLKRALSFADKLFREFEVRGHRVVLAPKNVPLRRPDLDHREANKGFPAHDEHWKPDRPTVAFIGTVAVGLTIFEMSEWAATRRIDGEARRVPFRKADYVAADSRDWSYRETNLPSRRLGLRASSPYWMAPWELQWREKVKGFLPQQVPAIVTEIEAAVPGLVEKIEIGERKAAEERRRQDVAMQKYEEEERQRRRTHALERSKAELLSIIEQWSSAKRVEAFFKDIESRLEGVDEDTRAVLRARTASARALLGVTDPLEHLKGWRSPDERVR